MRAKKVRQIALSLCTIIAIQSQVLADEVKENKEVEALDSVEVVSSNVTENTDSYTIDSMNTSTKLDLSIRETPQSVSVLTNEALTDFGIDSYQELLTNIAGVSINRSDERVQPISRGFEIDYYKIDGIPIFTYYASEDIDMALYDRVEVVKGANGLTTGLGSPAVSINLVRKRANSKKLKGSINIERGSWNERAVTADISSGLNESGSIRGRIVAKHLKSDSYMNGYEKEQNTFYGVIDADITDNTYISTGASYQKLDRKGVRWGGTPYFENVNRSHIFNEDWTKRNSTKKSFFSDFHHYFKDNISLNASYSYDNISSDNALVYYYPSGSTGSGWLNKPKEYMNNYDLNLKIPYEINSLNQQLIIGTSYNTYKKQNSNPTTIYYGITDLYNHSLSPTGGSYYNDGTERYRKQKSLYLANKISLSDSLKVIAGLRYVNFTEEYTIQDEKNKFNDVLPYLGVVYDINDIYSVYASYTNIFQQYGTRDKDKNYLDVMEGQSYETGIKGEFFDGKLNTSLSVFRVDEKNAPELTTTAISTSPYEAAYEAKDVTSKGFELDINGTLSDNINLKFGLAHFNAKTDDGDSYKTQASRTTANLYTTFKIDRFTLGTGLQYKGKFYVDTTSSGTIIQKAVTIANAMAKYKISKNLTAQFNINNIFDKKYYEGLASDATGVYADPRNMKLSLTYTF